jgi:hypothetical protein
MLGKIFENLLAEIDEETGKTARKKTGSFYTPREVVEYIVNTSLYNYLVNHTSVDKSKLQHLIESPETTPEIAKEDVNCILNIISSIKIIDPACGSGAFLMGAMHKMIEIIRVLDPNSYFWKEKIVSNIKDSVFSQYIKEKLKSENIYYIIKLGLLRDNLYGVDIQPMAIELTKLRFFLSLIVDETIVDEKDNRGILALPNLDFKFIAADYLLDLPTLKNKEVFYSSELKELKDIIDYYFTSYGEDKDQVKQRFINKKREFNNKFALSGNLTPDFVTILNWNPFSRESVDWFNPSWMFGMKESFNIIIANPPYVSNKNVDKIKKTLYKEKYGISDDLYNYFFLRSLDLLKPGGILSFISSDTYLSINSKQNLRTAFLENRIIEIFKINNPFENTMVSPAIITIQKDDVRKDYELVFKIAESQEEFFAKEKYQINSLVYKKTAFNTFFPPTKFNNMVWEKYGAKVNQLINKYWFMINSSDNIAKNSEFLEHYRKNLQPGDLTLLGLITDGGQGLATSDNGRFVGVREKTKEASRIKQTRPQKLYEAVKNNKIKELNINSLQDAKTRLADMTELQIRELFFRLKKVYGRDIFGVGYLFQIISESEIADPAYMTEEEKNEGIAAYKPHFVPYDKGDKGGNRWYLDTPFCLDWSKETVNFFISNSGKKGKGMPVVRNKEFYFHEGFCWSDVSKIIKCRLKGMSVHDVTSMSLFTLIPGIPNWFFVCILNSNFISEYVNSFINNTQHFQINDARQVPIIIPSPEQLNIFQQIFNEAYKIKIKQFSGELSKYQADQELKVVEERLDKYVLKYYDLE